MNLRLSAALATWIGLGLPARAHDFWIVPSGFRPATGERLSVQLEVGRRFEGDAVPRNPEKIEAFFAVDARGSRIPVEGIDGSSPAGFLRARTAGLAWIGYRSRTTAIEQNGAKFEAYLREEGLDGIALARERAGTSGPRQGDLLALRQGADPRRRRIGRRRLRSDPRSAARDRRRGEPVGSERELPGARPLPGSPSRRRARRLHVEGGSRRRGPRPDGRGGSRAVRARLERRLPRARRAHGPGSARLGRRLGELLGVSRLRAALVLRLRDLAQHDGRVGALRQAEAEAQTLARPTVDLDVAREDARRPPAARESRCVRARPRRPRSRPRISRSSAPGFAASPSASARRDRPGRRDLARATARLLARRRPGRRRARRCPPCARGRPGSRGRRGRGRSARRARR